MSDSDSDDEFYEVEKVVDHRAEVSKTNINMIKNSC